MKSKAFNEFVCKRCEEIIDTDEIHKKINKDIISFEEKLLDGLPKDKIEILQKIDFLKEQQLCNDYSNIYMSGFNDRISAF